MINTILPTLPIPSPLFIRVKSKIDNKQPQFVDLISTGDTVQHVIFHILTNNYAIFVIKLTNLLNLEVMDVAFARLNIVDDSKGYYLTYLSNKLSPSTTFSSISFPQMVNYYYYSN